MSVEFDKIAWMPIDLPKFDFKEEVISQYVEESIPYAHGMQRFTTKNKKYGKSEWLPSLEGAQLQLKEYIVEHIPFTDLVNVKIHRMDDYGIQHRHTDFFNPNDNIETYNHNLECEPAGYRMILRGKVKQALAIETDNGVFYPEVPEDTDWYVMGHTNIWHWNSADDPERYIVFMHLWLDKEKHFQLLEKSFKKYGHLAIWK